MIQKKPIDEIQIPNLAGRVDSVTEQVIRNLYVLVGGIHRKLKETLNAPPKEPDYRRISKELSAEGSAPLNVQGLVGQLSAPQRATVAPTPTNVNPTGAFAQDGTLAVINGVLSRYDGATRTWVPVATTGSGILTDTHANRTGLSKYTASSLPIGTLFWESDRTVLYINLGTFGASNWTYASGQMLGGGGSVPNDLGVHDVGFLFGDTTLNHVYQWSGAAWAFAPGDPGSKYIVAGTVAPLGGPWVLCNGGATTVANGDGTTSAYTTPNAPFGGGINGYVRR